MEDKGKQLPQYYSAIVVTLGGFSSGTIVAWFSSADQMVRDQLAASEEEISWISSIINLGAAASTFVLFFVFDRVGRKLCLFVLCAVLLTSWIIILFANTLVMYCVGRFLSGISAGGFCAAAPNYVAEFAHKDIRGRLGTFFQLQCVIAILITYALVKPHSLTALSAPLAVVPVVMFVLVIFLAESPVYLIKKGKEEAVRKSLQFYRGKSYENLDKETAELMQYAESDKESNLWENVKQKSTLKALGMLLIMHMSQQLGGINVIIFYAWRLFKMAGSTMTPDDLSILLGVVQLLSTVGPVYLVDRMGRRILWIISLSIMALSLIIIGIYFLIQSKDEAMAKAISPIPVMFINVYLAGYAFGAGPLPWAMLGELLPARMQSLSSLVACFNWLLSFLVTKTFIWMTDTFGSYTVFWMYAAFSILGLVLILLFVIETKGKTLAEIQAELSGSERS